MDSDYYLQYNKPYLDSNKRCNSCGGTKYGTYCPCKEQRDEEQAFQNVLQNSRMNDERNKRAYAFKQMRNFGPLQDQQKLQERGWTISRTAGSNKLFPNVNYQGKFADTVPRANARFTQKDSECRGGNSVDDNGDVQRFPMSSGFTGDLESLRNERKYQGANNIYYADGCPAIMEDGRFISTWRPSSEITNEIGTFNNIRNSNALREFMQTNALNLMRENRAYLTQTNTCNPDTSCSEGYYNLWMKNHGQWLS